MPVFSYSARPATGSGGIQQGEIDLKTKDEVLAHLHRQKLIPISVREKPKDITLKFGTGVGTRDIVIFTRQFATMINSGLPLVQALDSVGIRTTKSRITLWSVLKILFTVGAFILIAVWMARWVERRLMAMQGLAVVPLFAGWDMAAGQGPRRSLLALGYAGWDAGQLDQEIQQNGWLTLDPDESLIFGEPIDEKWGRAIAKLGLDLSKLSSVSGHA